MTKHTSPYLRHAERMGRNGDRHLVHVNDAEIGLLRRAGGSGTRNPGTGLLEFYRADRDQQSSREAGAARGGGSSGGGTGRADRDQQSAGVRGFAGVGGGGTGPNAAGGNQYAGYKGPVGTRAPSLAAPGSYGLSAAETRSYNAAKDEYQNRGLGKRIVDFFSPIKSIDPQINQPASWAAGQYHHGINPAGLVAGALAPYGSGLVAGPIAGSLWNGAGMHDLVLTGPGSAGSTSYPGGGPGYNSSTGFAGPGDSGSSPPGHADQSAGVTALQNLAQINQPVSGNPSAPQPINPTPGAPPSTPSGPNFQQIMANLQQITPGYGVQLPAYQYRRNNRATV